jgi:serine phosphatase RsbU (regulator of sigma subunit)
MSDPSSILGQLNRIVKRVNFGRLRMSLSVAKFDKKSVELSSAAMPPTYFFSSKSKKLEEVLVPNLPLGGLESEIFDGVKKEFSSGDVMVMISDGIPELPNPTNDLLDYEKVESCIKNNAEKSANQIKDALVNLCDDWAKGVMNPDDITIVVIKKVA